MRRRISIPLILAFTVLVTHPAAAQYSTPPATAAELEQAYSVAIEKRTSNILTHLELKDPAVASKVHDVIMAQYRALRSRDQAIDTMLKELSKDAPGAETNRATLISMFSKPLHARFLAKLSADLTPAQIESIKDQMTYNKVKVTYDAYCAIVTGLTDQEKARILDSLKVAREEAIDGGSADEKSAIFQKYKDEINAYLIKNGHDVAKDYREWEAKEALIRKTADNVKTAQ